MCSPAKPVQRGVDDVAVLDEHITRLAKMSGHPELPDVPVITFGHSNGTGFAASWPRDRPDRTIASVAFHPGFSDYLQYPNTENVPSLVMCGTIDKYLLRSRLVSRCDFCKNLADLRGKRIGAKIQVNTHFKGC